MRQTRIPRRVLPDPRERFADMMDAGVAKEEIMASLGVKKTMYFMWKKAYAAGGRGVTIQGLPRERLIMGWVSCMICARVRFC